jgi:hypothetical protein
MDTGCRNTHIALIQCAYKDLAYQFVESAGMGSSELPCLSLKMKIVSKYLSMLYCYKTLTTDFTFAYQFDVSSLEYSDIQLIEYQIATGLAITYYTSYDTENNYLYVYSYTVGANLTDIHNAILVVTSTTLPETDVIDNLDFLLDLWNCITYTQLCNIINHAYSLTTIAHPSTVISTFAVPVNTPPVVVPAVPHSMVFVATAGQTIFNPTSVFSATSLSKIYTNGVRVTEGFSVVTGTIVFAIGLEEGVQVICDEY